MPRLTAVLAVLVAVTAAAQVREPQVRGAQTFYRMLPPRTYTALPFKTESICADDGAFGTGGTGMAENFTEYPWCRGQISATYREHRAYYPRIASGVEIVQRRVNVFDIVMDLVYEPDGVVWGQAYREFGQSYVARGDELVSVTLLVASSVGTFHVALHEGGPDGRQVGGEKTFESGSSGEYGWAHWSAGEAPTVPGQTYYLRLWREDGQAWNPYLHSTGDLYADGKAFCDGRPEPETDLALYIVEQPDDLRRALVLGKAPSADAPPNTARVRIRPRSRNIRLVQVDLTGPEAFCTQIECRIYVDEDPPRLIAGPNTHMGCGQAGRPYNGSFLFGAKDVPVGPDEDLIVEIRHYEGGDHGAEVSPEPGKITALRLWAYGDSEIDAYPVPSNQRVSFPAADRMQLGWDISYPAPVEVEWWRPGDEAHRTEFVPSWSTACTLDGIEAGGVYWFRITAIGPSAKRWASPVYQVQAPGGDAEAPFCRYPAHPEAFLRLAPVPLCEASLYQPAERGRAVPLVNAGFEEGLAGWTVSGKTPSAAHEAHHGIVPREGARMAGWSLEAGEQREQVFAENELVQTIATQPGYEYEISCWAFTEAVGAARGETRVRLIANVTGGGDLDGRHSSQWYWTDGQWLRFARRFVAEGETATVGVGFFRWRDMDRASAYVDDVVVQRLGKAQ